MSAEQIAVLTEAKNLARSIAASSSDSGSRFQALRMLELLWKLEDIQSEQELESLLAAAMEAA